MVKQNWSIIGEVGGIVCLPEEAETAGEVTGSEFRLYCFGPSFLEEGKQDVYAVTTFRPDVVTRKDGRQYATFRVEYFYPHTGEVLVLRNSDLALATEDAKRSYNLGINLYARAHSIMAFIEGFDAAEPTRDE